jgi:hypothetical protein
MTLRRFHCCWCGNASTNQFGTTPYNCFGQLSKFPKVVLHDKCGVEIANELMEITKLSTAAVGINQFWSWHHDE